MPRDYNAALEDILEALEKIERYTGGVSRDKFVADPQKIDAVVRNLEVIGEAAKQVPGAVRLQHPQIEWRKLSALRDILIHQYFGIDLDIVWDVVRNKLPALKANIRELLEQ